MVVVVDAVVVVTALVEVVGPASVVVVVVGADEAAGQPAVLRPENPLKREISSQNL